MVDVVGVDAVVDVTAAQAGFRRPAARNHRRWCELSRELATECGKKRRTCGGKQRRGRLAGDGDERVVADTDSAGGGGRRSGEFAAGRERQPREER